MSVVGLNHFNISAPAELIEEVRDFYVEVLGLTVGDWPNFALLTEPSRCCLSNSINIRLLRSQEI